MKKLIYVSNANIPSNSASSVHIMKMCEAFKVNGVDITLVIPNHYNKKEYSSTDIFDFYGIRERFPVKRIKPIQKNVKGIREIIYSVWAVLYAIAKRPDAIMTRKIMAARIAAFLHFPYVLELHSATEPTHYSLKKTLQSRYMKKLIVISGALKDYMIQKYGIDPKNILVLHDAVNLDAYEKLDTKLDLNKEKLRIAYFGSLFPGKGIETIIRMAAADRKNVYDIYGERGPIEKWKKLAMETQSTVCFKGQIANAKVPETLIQYDIVLMPYSNKVEVYGEDLTNWMSPLKMFEYMASGRVIVSSDMPVIREILTDHVNAYLVEPDCVEAWIAAIEEISGDKEKALKCAECAKQKVKEYTWTLRAAKVSECI